VNLLNLKLKIDKLILKSKSLIPLRSRKLKLKPPFNVCKSLITFKNDQININKDEECIIENNSDLAWKLVTPNGQVSIIFYFLIFLGFLLLQKYFLGLIFLVKIESK
jgi:hypothetical protein